MYVLCIERLSFYPLHHGGLCKDYSYSPEIISCSMLTDNDECIGYITEKDGRLFCYIVTHFRGCNGIGDLLTRQARNFIYTVAIFTLKAPSKIAADDIFIIFTFIFRRK